MDHKTERSDDLNRIKNSDHPRKVVVAGPGTGKSHLFSQLIKKKISEGKNKFLAITFIGKLGDTLADDLCGLAETATMHGFARKFVLNTLNDREKEWVYYPNIYKVIKEDLEKEGIKKFEIGDENYKEKTAYYKAVGNADVVYYAVQICKKDPLKIPQFDLILVDEFQDFNADESEFIDELAKKNEIVIVGDDDQALYEFKGSSPEFIRQKYDASNDNWESHTLRFCSRCTEVIIRYFHALVDKFGLNNPSEPAPEKRRVEKDYICYAPIGESDSKIEDSIANPKIHLIKNCPTGMIPSKIQSELEEICRHQKVKDVLIIGEARSCKTILSDTARILVDYGFKYVNYQDEDIIKVDDAILDAYGFLSKNKDSLIGWRLLENPTESEKEEHLKNAVVLRKILQKESVAESSIDRLISKIDQTTKTESEIKKILIKERIKRQFKNSPRPVSNLEITVCNILNSKGLGADIVFVLGFDQGKLPNSSTPTNSEIYQMLVSITRAKKRVYLINTSGKGVSKFIDSIESADLDIEEI